MPENTFDIVSKIDLAEVNNAVQQALKEIHQRFDLKDSKSDIQLNEKDNKLVLASLDDYKLKAVSDVLQQKLVKRNVSLKGLTFGPITPAAGSSVRQEVTLQQRPQRQRVGFGAHDDLLWPAATNCSKRCPATFNSCGLAVRYQ